MHTLGCIGMCEYGVVQVHQKVLNENNKVECGDTPLVHFSGWSILFGSPAYCAGLLCFKGPKAVL